MGKTITQKIFETHKVDEPFEGTYVLSLDSVFCHEITTPIAINDLVTRKKDRVYDKNKIKAVIDHVTPAKDSKTAEQGKIMRDWAQRHNITDFFDIGQNGVCHALFPEHGFVHPGFTVIMGDSHTCTHGAFGAFAAGVGTTDLEVGILKGVCAFREPKSIKVNIIGKLKKGVYAKDVILKVIKELTVNGATDSVIEFHGNIVKSFSMESRMTLCNMAIEAGATSGICMPDKKTAEYLKPFIKNPKKDIKKTVLEYKKWHSDKDAHYSKYIDINVSDLLPQTTIKYKPDQVIDINDAKDITVDQVYIGSCTNGRLEDLKIAAKILKGKKIASNVRGIVSPATPKVFAEANKLGIIDIFMRSGFCVTNPTCGACLGMSNGVLAENEVCASTTNRNFYGRMGKGGMVHLMSPASAAATAIAGKITDPRKYLK